jgi:hypothetical protein
MGLGLMNTEILWVSPDARVQQPNAGESPLLL